MISLWVWYLVLSLSSFRENKRHEKVPHGGLGSFRCGIGLVRYYTLQRVVQYLRLLNQHIGREIRYRRCRDCYWLD